MHICLQEYLINQGRSRVLPHVPFATSISGHLRYPNNADSISDRIPYPMKLASTHGLAILHQVTQLLRNHLYLSKVPRTSFKAGLPPLAQDTHDSRHGSVGMDLRRTKAWYVLWMCLLAANSPLVLFVAPGLLCRILGLRRKMHVYGRSSTWRALPWHRRADIVAPPSWYLILRRTRASCVGQDKL